MLRGRFGEIGKDFRDGHVVMDAFQQAAFRDHIRSGERILYLASMGLLKHKRTRNTIAAEPTPRSSEGSVTPRLQDRIASGTTNANIANPKQHCRPASANSAGPTCSRTKARYDTDIPANLTTSSTGDNLDLHNKRGRSRGASESNASDGHDFVQSPACNGHIPKPEDVTHSNSHDRTSCSKGNICIEGYDMIRGGEGCTGQRGPLGSPLPTAEDQNISTQQRHGKENHTLRHAGPTRQAGGNSICNSKEDYLRRRRRRAALDGTIAGSVDRSPLRNSRNSREGPELKSADVRRRPKIAEVRQQVGRTSLRRKPERRVPRNKQADRRKLFCNRILNNGDTLHLKRRVSGSSSENEYLDRDDVWRQGKTKRMGWHGGNEAALGNASNASCLTDPRFMPISAVEKLFSGKRLAAVQARDPQTAAAVRAARANRLVTIRSIQNKKNMSRRYGGTSSSVAKAGCPMPMVRVREKREGRGRPMTMGKRECGRKNWDIKPTVKIRPKSAPPMRSTCGSVVARDGGDHYPRVHTVENGKGIAKNNGETDGRASSRIGTASRSSSARTSGTETSDITRSCSTCSLSTTRDTHRSGSEGQSSSRKKVDYLLVELETLRRRLDLAEAQLHNVPRVSSRRRPYTAHSCRDKNVGEISSGTPSVALATLATYSAKTSTSGGLCGGGESVVRPLVATHSASAFLNQL